MVRPGARRSCRCSPEAANICDSPNRGMSGGSSVTSLPLCRGWGRLHISGGGCNIVACEQSSREVVDDWGGWLSSPREPMLGPAQVLLVIESLREGDGRTSSSWVRTACLRAATGARRERANVRPVR